MTINSKESATFKEYTDKLLSRDDISMSDLYNDDYDIDLSINLVNARRECSMTQAELATSLGTKQPNIARFENGTNLPSHEMIKKIARVLGVRPIAPNFEKIAAYTTIQLTPSVGCPKSPMISTQSNFSSISLVYVR